VDGFQAQREVLRELVAIHKHLGAHLDHPVIPEVLRGFYREKDWMIPKSPLFS
jgi:hypothetical protein